MMELAMQIGKLRILGLSFSKAREAVTAIEYALIAALIAVFIIGALQLVGTNISTVFGGVASAL
jgi:pilus assembly protein Flp/PilA